VATAKHLDGRALKSDHINLQVIVDVRPLSVSGDQALSLTMDRSGDDEGVRQLERLVNGTKASSLAGDRGGQWVDVHRNAVDEMQRVLKPRLTGTSWGNETLGQSGSSGGELLTTPSSPWRTTSLAAS